MAMGFASRLQHPDLPLEPGEGYRRPADAAEAEVPDPMSASEPWNEEQNPA